MRKAGPLAHTLSNLNGWIWMTLQTGTAEARPKTTETKTTKNWTSLILIAAMLKRKGKRKLKPEQGAPPRATHLSRETPLLSHCGNTWRLAFKKCWETPVWEGGVSWHSFRPTRPPPPRKHKEKEQSFGCLKKGACIFSLPFHTAVVQHFPLNMWTPAHRDTYVDS